MYGAVKKVKGQLKIIIPTNLVELKSLMKNTKSQPQSFLEKIFLVIYQDFAWCCFQNIN